jgi:hypothetical protein
VTFTFQSLFLQGTLGYSTVAAGAVGVPVALLLTFLSTPAGQLSARFGPRLFMTVGPLLMAAGLLWLARIPPDSTPWRVGLPDSTSPLPPVAVAVDVLPGLILFGLGISMVVAPLTTALMSSVPVQKAGLGSAINNAISRVGSPLIGAVLFIAITATFYPTLSGLVPGLNVDDPEVRERIQPLTSTPDDIDPALADAARQASTDAFHLSMLVSAGLLVAGAAVNAIGIRNPSREALESRAAEGAQPAG